MLHLSMLPLSGCFSFRSSVLEGCFHLGLRNILLRYLPPYFWVLIPLLKAGCWADMMDCIYGLDDSDGVTSGSETSCGLDVEEVRRVK
jgi:hypothetical protein